MCDFSGDFQIFLEFLEFFHNGNNIKGDIMYDFPNMHCGCDYVEALFYGNFSSQKNLFGEILRLFKGLSTV